MESRRAFPDDRRTIVNGRGRRVMGRSLLCSGKLAPMVGSQKAQSKRRLSNLALLAWVRYLNSKNSTCKTCLKEPHRRFALDCTVGSDSARHTESFDVFQEIAVDIIDLQHGLDKVHITQAAMAMVMVAHIVRLADCIERVDRLLVASVLGATVITVNRDVQSSRDRQIVHFRVACGDGSTVDSAYHV